MKKHIKIYIDGILIGTQLMEELDTPMNSNSPSYNIKPILIITTIVIVFLSTGFYFKLW